MVEKIIEEFDEIDKWNIAFRYAYKDAHIVDLPDRPIDLTNAQDVMKGVHNYFTGADGMLDSHGC